MELFVEKQLIYEAPQIEVIEVEVEIGFAGSDPGGDAGDYEGWN